MSDIGVLEEYRLSGSFRLASREDIVVGGQHHGRRLHGELTGYEIQVGLGLAKEVCHSRFNVEILELVNQRSAGGTAMLVSLKPSQESLLDHEVVVAWDGEALEISGLWVAQPLGLGSADLVFSQLERDDAVFEPDDLDHQAAREALAAVAQALGDPGFVTEAAAKLFPSSGSHDAKFEVRGVHDWVLFHARHRKQCSFEPSPAPYPRPMRYRVYARHVAGADGLGALSNQLEQDAAQLEQVEFTALGTVEFEPGAATLTSSSTRIQPWWPHGDQRELAWAGIAGGTAGGDQLALARLLALEQSIEGRPPPASKHVLQQVPAVFELGGADGVIVLLTWCPQPVPQVSLYFADEAVIGQLLGPNLPQGVGLDQLFESMSKAVWHIGKVALRGGEFVNAKRNERRTLVPGRLVAYTYEGDPACPKGNALEQLARRVFEDVGVQTSDIRLSHVELAPRPNACGDVVLVGVGTVGERDVSERATTRR